MSRPFECEHVQRWIDGEESLADEGLTRALSHLEACETCAALFADAQYLRGAS